MEREFLKYWWKDINKNPKELTLNTCLAGVSDFSKHSSQQPCRLGIITSCTYSWGNQGTERLTMCLVTAQPASGRARAVSASGKKGKEGSDVMFLGQLPGDSEASYLSSVQKEVPWRSGPGECNFWEEMSPRNSTPCPNVSIWISNLVYALSIYV